MVNVQKELTYANILTTLKKLLEHGHINEKEFADAYNALKIRLKPLAVRLL